VLFHVWHEFGMNDHSMLTHFVRRVFRLVTTIKADIQGVWQMKCETNWLQYRPLIFTLLHFVSSHFVQEEASASLK
jgi:hypothetical protein